MLRMLLLLTLEVEPCGLAELEERGPAVLQGGGVHLHLIYWLIDTWCQNGGGRQRTHPQHLLMIKRRLSI